MKKIFISLLVFIIAVCFLFPLSASADFGNFDTYGGDYSSDWDWGSDSSWDSGGSVFFPYYYGTDSDSDFGDLPLVILVIIVIVIIYVILAKKKGTVQNTQHTRRSTYSSILPQNKNTEITAKIKEHDENFTDDAFLSFANSAYVNLQNAWSERDTEKIRLLLSEELYSQTKAQIDEYVRLGRKNIMERIAVKESYLTDYINDDSLETLTVYLYATQKDYIIDENSSSVLEGSKEEYRHSKYLISFVRKSGVKTNNEENITASNCPNCGAPLEISATGRCAYCDSVISNDNHSWVIFSLRRIN